jgi:hypothetical protein
VSEEMPTAERSRGLWIACSISGVITVGLILLAIRWTQDGPKTVSRFTVLLGSLPIAAFCGTCLAITGQTVWRPILETASWFKRGFLWYARVVWICSVLAAVTIFGVLWSHFLLAWW